MKHNGKLVTYKLQGYGFDNQVRSLLEVEGGPCLMKMTETALNYCTENCSGLKTASLSFKSPNPSKIGTLRLGTTENITSTELRAFFKVTIWVT